MTLREQIHDQYKDLHSAIIEKSNQIEKELGGYYKSAFEMAEKGLAPEGGVPAPTSLLARLNKIEGYKTEAYDKEFEVIGELYRILRDVEKEDQREAINKLIRESTNYYFHTRKQVLDI